MRRAPWAGGLLAAALACGCGREDVEIYRVPKEGASALEAAAPAAPTPAGRALSWDAPAGWQPRPAGGMRYATFVIPGPAGEAELSVVTLPGDAGGALANVNRWRGQIALAPLDAKGLESLSRRVESRAGPLRVVDFSAGRSRLLAAILSKGGSSWFFKMTGPPSAVGAAKPGFLLFLKSLR